MAKNVDTIFFGKYLESTRKEHKANVEDLAYGICDRSLITKIECGERSANMLLRDRLLERLGASSDEYESYLKVNEFIEWQQIQNIIKLVSEANYSVAKKTIDEYKASVQADNIIAQQFYCDMEAMIAVLTDSSDAKTLLEIAIHKTIHLDERYNILNKWLAPAEINLLIEYSEYLPSDEQSVLLNDLLTYVNTNTIDERNLAMFYPKLVFRYVSNGLKTTKTSEWLKQSIKLLDSGLSCLSKTKYLIYYIELLEIKLIVMNSLYRTCDYDYGYGVLIKESISNCEDEIHFYESLSNDYNIELHTKDWTYLYIKECVLCTGTILRRRRVMLGLSQEDVDIDICSDRTLYRAEQLKTDIHPQKLRRILLRLNLSNEYQKSQLSITDSETKQYLDKIRECANSRQYDQTINLIMDLEHRIKSPTPEDMQFLITTRTMMLYRKKLLDADSCYEQLLNALRLTIPPKCGLEGDIYLTRNEYLCIYNMVALKNGNVSDDLIILVINTCAKMKHDSSEYGIGIVELLMAANIKIQLAQRNYVEAEKICHYIINLDLRRKRTGGLLPSFNERILILEGLQESRQKVDQITINRNDYYLSTLKRFLTNAKH